MQSGRGALIKTANLPSHAHAVVAGRFGITCQSALDRGIAFCAKCAIMDGDI